MIRPLTYRAFTLALLVAAAPLARGAYPEALFILDASGSMRDAVGEQRKIDAAKHALTEVVPTLDPEVHVGLIAFGGRRPGDCTDVETLVPAGSDDRETLLGLLGQVEPRGKSPISSALLTVSSQLKNKDAETSIVLVGDGAETCGGDPCEVVHELKQAGHNFVLYVVGLDVDLVTAGQLECLANQGGGVYFAASNGDELLEALQTIGEAVRHKVEAARVIVTHRQSGVGKLLVSMPRGSDKSLAALEITRVSDGQVAKSVNAPPSDSHHSLRDGLYRVDAMFATPNYGEPTRTRLGVVTVAKGETREIELGAIAFDLPETLVTGDWKDTIGIEAVELYDSGTDHLVVRVPDNRNGYFNFVAKPVPAGVYDVRLRYNRAETATTLASHVLVRPGRTAVVTINSALQVYKNDGGVRGWRLYRHVDQTPDAAEDGDAGSPSRSLVFETNASPDNDDRLWLPYLLPPGTFRMEVDLEGQDQPHSVAASVKIEPGKLLHFDMGL